MVLRVCEMLHISERRACLVLAQTRSTQRRMPNVTAEEERLRKDIIKLAAKYGRHG